MKTSVATKSCLALVVAAAAARGLAEAGAAPTSSGDFAVLSMNVAGLPEFLNGNGESGNKTTNTLLIGQAFARHGWDVIHVQEDFNYHAGLYAADNHMSRTSTSGGAGLGSGLNTLANLNWVDFSRVKWDACSDASENDCLTPKGFTFMRVAVATSNTTSVYVDFYNLHADAGTMPGDEVARNANINQVASYIATRSVGNAVVVFGDTNSRYTRTADTAIVSLLASANSSGPRLTDAWLELQRGGVVPTVESLCSNPSPNDTCEVVDKVFYRSGPLVNLKATQFHYVGHMFLDQNGSALSDHDPVQVNMTWSAGATLQQSDFWGGPHGDWFSDVPTLAAAPDNSTKLKVTALKFRGGERLDSVGLTLADGTRFTHGGTGGDEVALTLGASEAWTQAKLCKGEYKEHTRNFYIRATTSAGNRLEAGTATDDCTTFTAPDRWQIVGFLGQHGDEMDQLAFVYAPQ
ncbi:hypothetical protein P8C59_003435 [Phyllachora maydis]|uniref:Jacalin-type lectin domain-containing protein n=2 Tax=Phyllachora maydis TaxID=1825666 RepID=A0AAD9I1F5_9PEZI|nr:hypothetical protein P8C59_003435 [Phyllachora maydis]